MSFLSNPATFENHRLAHLDPDDRAPPNEGLEEIEKWVAIELPVVHTYYYPIREIDSCSLPRIARHSNFGLVGGP